MKKTSRGRFIVFEGLDGAGLTTQARILHERFIEMDIPCNRSAEPTHGPIGGLLKQWLAHRVAFDAATVAALFAADRLDHLYNPVSGVQARLADGITEISERYFFSSLAYQSVDLDMDWVAELNRKALMPDVVFFIDIEPKQSYERIVRRQTSDEVFESLDSLSRVAVNFLVALERYKKKTHIVRIDGSGTKADIAAQVWEHLNEVAPLSGETVLPLWNRRPPDTDKGAKEHNKAQGHGNET
jgi:dTMP kinase